ncbi:MAG TPA: hypothetical protein VFD58_02750 [Blastocatellia bacterium]|nr:hypothetical protein [Blastocatellia bacterium]
MPGALQLVTARKPASVVGAMLNLNSDAAAKNGAYNGGRNFHHLTLTPHASLSVPIFPPFC